MSRRSVPRRVLGWLAGLAAATLILLAVAVGIARLLLPLAPDYQEEIRLFASRATGLDIRFARLNATWPLQGPEVRFTDVRIFTRDGAQPVLDAEELSVGLSFWRILRSQRLLPARIGLRKADLQVDRLTDGQLAFNGIPVAELIGESRGRPLPRLDVDLQDIALRIRDPSRQVPRVRLQVRQLKLGVDPDVISYRGSFDGRDGLGRNLEASGQVPVGLLQAAMAGEGESPPGGTGNDSPGDQAWELRFSASELDFPRWLALILDEAVPLEAGRGAVDLTATLQGRQLRTLALDIGVMNPRFTGLAEADNDYRRVAVRGSFTRSNAGLEGVLERLAVERSTGGASAGSGRMWYSAADDAPARLRAEARSVRLEHVWPLVRLFANPALENAELRDRLRLPGGLVLPESLQGEIGELQLDATLPEAQDATYAAEAGFRGVGLTMPGGTWGIAGLTGNLQADEQGGRVALKFRNGLLRFPALFREDIRTRATEGQIAWRVTPGGLEVLTDDLRIATEDAEGRARLRLSLPPDESPLVDLTARFTATSAPAALRYVPLKRFKPRVAEWLDRAVIAGRVPRAELLWQGPVRGVPYPAGEGRFRLELDVEDVVLAYAPAWPRLENAGGTVVIDGATLTSTGNRGVIAGLSFQDVEVGVENLLRDARLAIGASDQLQVNQILGFLRESPVAATLDPLLQSVTGGGSVAAAISLEVPIAAPRDYRLRGTFGLRGNSLGLKGVAFGLADLRGTLRLQNTVLIANGVEGQFLDEPVEIQLRAAVPAEPELSQVVEVTGSTPADKLVAAFSLPYGSRFSGDVGWQAQVQVPARRGGPPLQIDIRSELTGLQSSLPPPLSKAAGRPEALSMVVRWPGAAAVQIVGGIERGVSWALQLDQRQPGGWRLERGALRSGARLASLPAEAGLKIGGSFDQLRLEDWLPGRGMADAVTNAAADNLINDLDIEVARLAVLGRIFRDVGIDARRDGQAWRAALRGPDLAGTVTLPLAAGPDAPLILDLERLHAGTADAATGDGSADPRKLPPVRAEVADFSVGDLRLGRLRAEVSQRGDGVVLDPLRLDGDGFSIQGDGLWVVLEQDPARQRSQLSLQLDATNIATTLVALGYDPVVEGDKAGVTANLSWPGGPRADFLAAAAGRVTVELAKGRFLPVEPGGGRILGLLSIAALPRRLGLDFSDVVNQGLAFDEVRGEFRLEDGNAFTCNFGLAGPAAALAVVGRTNLRDRSYDQLAVVRPPLSDVLAVGGFMGGPVVGGTILLMSQIFRKPLSTIGESYYRISGGWEKPVVERVQRSEIDLSPFRDCERYLTEVLQQLPPEAGIAP